MRESVRRLIALAAIGVLGANSATAVAAQRPSPKRVAPAYAAPPGALPAVAVTARDVPADARVGVCYNYGCATEVEVRVDGATLDAIRVRLAASADAAIEREVLADAVGMLYGVAARQTPVGADRAGNYLDQEVEGRMDCIDHSTSTTRLLKLIEARGWLRFHRVLDPARRSRIILQHFGAVVEEIAPATGAKAQRVAPAVPDYVPTMLALCDCAEVANDVSRPQEAAMQGGEPHPGQRFVVDSWFVDNGQAAVVLPLAEWLDGGGPNVQ